MVAAPFVGNVIVKYASGRKDILYVTFSDVANEFGQFRDSSGEFIFEENTLITDIILDTGGTDTTGIEIWKDARDTGKKLYNDNFLNTRQLRPISPSNPLGFKAGSKIKLKQVA